MKLIDHYQVFLKDGSNVFVLDMSRKGKIRHVEYADPNSLFLIVENRPDSNPYVLREFMLVDDPEKLEQKVKFITNINRLRQPAALLYEVLPS